MFYDLIQLLEPWLKQRGVYGFFRVWTYPEFRAVMSLVLSFLIVIGLGPTVIRWLIKQKIGDNPEFNHKELNQLVRNKTNTPTMGGILIAFAVGSTTLLLADMRCFYVHMAILCLLWLAGLGAIDDWLKLTTARRSPGSRHGLYSWEKMVFQLGLAVLLGIFIHHYGQTKYSGESPDILMMSRSLTLPFMRSWEWLEGVKVPAANLIVLGTWPFAILTIIVITGSSNAVNLTDGMDGLASGIMSIVGFALMVLALIAGDEVLAKRLLVPYIPMSNELAIVAGAMTGACVGFLWYNCSPAQVFMGDTGSLPLGGLMGFIAVVVRQEFLLLIIGGVFVLEAISVMMQVSYFKATGGKRIFRCAPIHHHFHLGGWTEQQVVVRFWLITAILAAMALATVKLR
ncbi:MAG: phospho-N-acetylmuramoyl-pentapeptide-transferase [Phycisphaeraceae bacterium]|nr:phospho-N-acetylmuramoyl-pentapeptide-transferase [Phycisphaeraceae bacterium]